MYSGVKTGRGVRMTSGEQGGWLGDEEPGAAAKVWQRLSQGMTGRAGCRG